MRSYLLIATILAVGGMSPGQDTPIVYYASPEGTSAGDGSLDAPMDLATALGPQSRARPGDTILLRGGTYTGAFNSTLAGEDGRPIVVRQYAGERATIDGSLTIRGAWTWYWGFDVGNSNPDRTKPRPAAVSVLGPNTKLITLTVHDAGNGVESWTPAVDAELYGCLIYRNGYQGPEPDRGHGHGLYVQNDTGTKRIVDNILFNGYGYGIHAYTEGGSIKGMHFEGNIIFNSGKNSREERRTSNILVGGQQPCERITVIGNSTYTPIEFNVSNSFGYGPGPDNRDAEVRDNYFAGGGLGAIFFRWEKLVITNNTYFANPLLFQALPPRDEAPYSWEVNGNTYIAPTYGAPLGLGNNNFTFANWQRQTGYDRDSQWISNPNRRPAGAKVIARPNQYEPGRVHLAVYNWDLQETVSVDLQGLVEAGASYEVRNVLDYFGPPVASGVYSGQPVVVPMAGTDSGPEFNAFVLTSRRASVPPRVRKTR